MLATPEKGSDVVKAVAHRGFSHAGQSGRPGAPCHAKQEGLGLIVERMRGRQVGRTETTSAIDKQGVAVVARALLETRNRLLALPRENKGVEPEPSRRSRDLIRFAP